MPEAVRRPSPQRAWYVSGPLAVLTVVFTIVAQIERDIPRSDLLLIPIFFALFLVTDATTLWTTSRRQGLNVTLNEVAIVLAFFFISPLTMVVLRCVERIAIGVYRREIPARLWFNVTLATSSAAFGYVVIRALGSVGTDVTPRTWLVLIAGVLAATHFGLVAVVLVLGLVEGNVSGSKVLRIAVPGFFVTGGNIMLGLAVLLLIDQTPWALTIIGALVLFAIFAYRSYSQFTEQHRKLSELYDLVRDLKGTVHDRALPDVLLRRVLALTHADWATLWLPASSRHLEVLLSARHNANGLLDTVVTPDALRRRALETGESVLITSRAGELRDELPPDGPREVMIVPLFSGEVPIGTLEVAGERNRHAHFDSATVALMETVAAHAAVAVENSRLVDRLRYDAYHDGLTRLPNRRRITEALAESITVNAPDEVVAVLLFSLERLHEVNESLGQAAGDRLVAEIAGRLRSAAPPAALVGRAGGDEFVVTLRKPSVEAATQLAAHMRDEVRGSVRIDDLTVVVDVAVGVAVHPDDSRGEFGHADKADRLLQRAKLASASARTSPSGVQRFHTGLESRVTRRLGLADDLRQALERDEIEVYFQPKVTLADRRLVGVECLARWEHPAFGSVSPEDFVAVAENTGQIGALTEAVLRAGLQRCRDWPNRDDALSIAVNVSARLLDEPAFPTQVRDLLEHYGVAADRVTFEIGQPALAVENERALPVLRRLRDLGVRISVDDFGVGASSLGYLRRLPIAELKVDRRFVQGMATDPGDLAVVRATVMLARQFGLTAVAEGVESELALDLLTDMGCEIGQGFLFSRPLPYERLEAWYWAQTEVEATPSGEFRRLRAVP
ncbi:putative bifunctional diguanylate cyclase/phosphodiesterase [Catenuloplanes atrovinosus]|uniref:Diguanylate cyclase (GGDEF)-like protein n=1 Tax=Catenuloplanes atrovinosus TaxID=137266 RepID=A0AAE4CFD4_9ACTN|nr:sensor domain-containing phosphodiesterase [Catenuloplanes atrovinosus]MDR7279495.1 diguanylate cyclase (GGDEF)-like protein [Catenuloplanes atrovinosus]